MLDWLLLLPTTLLACTASLVHANLLDARTTVLPAPYDFPADEHWDGVDGTWSTFSLQVGTPAQTVRTLLSFQSYQTWVVIPEGCYGAASTSVCAAGRGGIFTYNDSSTWDFQGTYYLYIDQNLGLTGNAYYAYEVVTLADNGENGPTLKNTTVAGTAGLDFYLGLFGVNPKPTNFTSLDNPAPSYMTQLKDNSDIPSVSFGYTAGAYYRFSSGVYASLTLGGYDTSKYTANNVTFNFGADNDHEIIVVLTSIVTPSNTSSSPGGVQLLPDPVYIEIDSTVPEIWLPVDACRAFEAEFGLVYNATFDRYLVNDTLHASLLARNANVTFTIAQQTSGGESLQIILPYAAFDQVAKYPYVDLANDTNYFPLRRGMNSTQYILGRTFMQEAYIIVDYEVSRFQLAQVVWDENASKNIVAIPPANESQSSSTWTSSTYVSSYSTASSSSTSTAQGLSTGAIVGIVIGAVAAVALAVLAFFLIRRRRQNKSATEITKSFSDERSDTNETKVYPKAELMGSAPAPFGVTHHDMDGKLGQTPSSASTAYSPSSSGYLHAPDGTLPSANSAFSHSPLAEAHSRPIYEMPGDIPNKEKDGRQLSEKEALQHRERIFNGIDEAIEQESPTGQSDEERNARRVAPEEVVNAQTGDAIGRHRAFSFEFDSDEREHLTHSSGSTLVHRSPVSAPDNDTPPGPTS